MSELEAKNIIKKSVEIAKQARDESKIGMLFKYILQLNCILEIEKLKESVKIAGSIGPFGACLCDGSEFDGTYANNMSIEVK